MSSPAADPPTTATAPPASRSAATAGATLEGGGHGVSRGAKIEGGVGALDEQAMTFEELEGELDRRSRRPPEARCELVERPGAVEQRQQRRQEHTHRAALEDDDRLPVFEQEPVAVADESIPRCEERPLQGLSVPSRGGRARGRAAATGKHGCEPSRRSTGHDGT